MTTTRANIITRRTYSRPTNEAGTQFETWEQTISRVISHQRWLWERAQGKPLNSNQETELELLRNLFISRKALPAGRSLWLGGTDIARRREASQFNCSFLRLETVHDFVDALWLLLQGCGVGGQPVTGALSGFASRVTVEVIPSSRTEAGGREHNVETFDGTTWTISIGDSAEAWAKSIGKILAGKYAATKLVIDFSQIRPSGVRLKGYGWISSGYGPLAAAYEAIAGIMNNRVDQLLTRMDLLDIFNWLGTVLSSRRSAEIALCPSNAKDWREFATAKKDYWVNNPQRAQSNNSLMFYSKPSKFDLHDIFDLMEQGGGSEPGFINAEAATRRAPWFKGVNPCAEILLGNRSFCNLVEVDLGRFNNSYGDLKDAVWLVARANYRQTCVNLDDGILQRSWHELNQFLRLCGVGVTGVVRWKHQADPSRWAGLHAQAQWAARSMAEELGMPMPKAVTTIKPSGTISKIMDTTEGIHKPLGAHIFNNVMFGLHDPIVHELAAAGYRIMAHPTDKTAVIVTFPVRWDDVSFTEKNGLLVNTDSAVDQLNRYKMVMDNYVEHNCSITVSYDKHEVSRIIDWLNENWDSYVGVSFIYRADPTKRAADLGYPYLPQEVVTETEWRAYSQTLAPVNTSSVKSTDDLLETECVSGVCPVR
jgi:ribonucleoside-triphosphate reductase